MIFAFLAPLALKLSPVGRVLKAIPRPVWIAIGIAAALGFAWWWHADAVKDARAAGYAAGTADTEKRIEQKAIALKRKADALTAAISRNLKDRNDAENRAIAGRADDQRLRGPGKAACPGTPRLPAAPGGSGATGGNADAAGPGLPVEQRAAVPWGWLVGRAEQCDLNRAEVLSWRDWYRQQAEAWKTIEADGK